MNWMQVEDWLAHDDRAVVPLGSTDHPAVRVKFHNWWRAPETWAMVQAIDPVADHASWMENLET